MEIYVVRRGDTLYALARRFSVPTEDIVYANQLQNPDLLMVGQALLIPRAQTRYTVRWGDTLNAIALRYGLSLRRLLDANPQITNPDRIIAGQALFLPPSSPYQGDMLVNGYVTDVSEDTLRATLPYLSFLSPFSYRIDMAGNLIRSFRVMPELSAVQQVANLLTLTNLREQGGFSSDVAHAVFTDGDIQSRLLSQLEQILEAGGYRGVNLDFEYVYPFDRDSYNQFLQRLTDRLHGLGYLVVSALAPKLSDSQQGLLYAAHDYAFHGKTVDYVVLMTYEWGYTYGPAMAVSPLHMVKRVLDYAVSVMPAGKILMGVPNYGYDWTLPFVQGSADDLRMFPEQSFDAILDFCILHHVEGWRRFFDESRRVLRDGGSIYVADLSRTCIHMVDALLHWDHAEEALFSLKEFEEEANRRGFATVHKASDLGLEGYFRFRKEA